MSFLNIIKSFQKGENDSERQSRVTSISNRQHKSNKDLLEIDHEKNLTEQVSLPTRILSVL